MELLAVLVLLVGLGILGAWIYILRQGDADMEIQVAQRTPLRLLACTEQEAVFETEVPFYNKGNQDGIFMDAFARHLLPQEQYDGVRVSSRLELATARREDGYFEAVIVPRRQGGSFILTVNFTAREGTAVEALQRMVDMPVEIIYQLLGRSDCFLDKERLVMTAAEIRAALPVPAAAAPEMLEGEA